jgi:hypothetical protein
LSAKQYLVVVNGERGGRYASAFEGMTVFAHDGVTELTGLIVDAAQLHGLLEQITGLGLTVHSLALLDSSP